MKFSLRGNGKLDQFYSTSSSSLLRTHFSKSHQTSTKRASIQCVYITVILALCIFFGYFFIVEFFIESDDYSFQNNSIFLSEGRVIETDYGYSNKDFNTDQSSSRGNLFSNRFSIKNSDNSVKNDEIPHINPTSTFFHFLVYGNCDYDQLLITLNPILSIQADNDRIDLTLVRNCNNNDHRINDIRWTYGKFRLIQSQTESSMNILEYWWPSSDNEILFFVSSDSILSPDFFPILKETTQTVLNMQLKPGYQILKPNSNRINQTVTDPNLELRLGEYDFTSEKFLGLSLDPLSAFADLEFLKEGGARDGVSNPFLSQYLADTCQVIFSDTWNSFLRWKKISQSEIEENNKNMNPNAIDLTSQCSSDWKKRLSTFLVENQLFNLHVNYDASKLTFCKSGTAKSRTYRVEHPNPIQTSNSPTKSLPDYLRTSLPNLQSFPRYDTCYRRIRKPVLATSIPQLEMLLQSINMNKSIICIMVSPSFHLMTLNWLCYAKDLKLTNLVFITHSKSQAFELLSLGQHVYFPEGNKMEDSSHSESLNYGSLNYKKFIFSRTHAIGELLRIGYKILLADVDQAWLSNPFPHMQDPEVDMFAAQELYDFCGGFLYLMPSKRMISLWDNTTKLYSDHLDEISNHPSRNSNQSEYDEYLYLQRNVHEQWYLTQSLKRNDFEVKFKGLDRMLFMNGNDYFDEKVSINRNSTPVMIHNNYIVGRDNKTTRFQTNGMWRLDSRGYCLCISAQCLL